MDQRESQFGEDIENTRTAMAEKIGMIEERVNETMEGTKSKIDDVMEGTKSKIDNVMDKVKGVQGTIDEAKATIDDILETMKQTMEETIERVKYTANLIEQVDQNPWIMFGSAILTGYVLSSLNRGGSSGQMHTPGQGRNR